MNTTKQAIVDGLRRFIGQRSGIEWQNYGGSREAFLGDYRPMLRHGKQARAMLRAVELRDGISGEDLIAASRRVFSGRLEIVLGEDGKVAISYCTGQYFPTEYRAAACAVLADVLWTYWRESMKPADIANCPAHHPNVAQGIVNVSDYIRRQARNEFGRGIAAKWFR